MRPIKLLQSTQATPMSKIFDEHTFVISHDPGNIETVTRKLSWDDAEDIMAQFKASPHYSELTALVRQIKDNPDEPYGQPSFWDAVNDIVATKLDCPRMFTDIIIYELLSREGVDVLVPRKGD